MDLFKQKISIYIYLLNISSSRIPLIDGNVPTKSIEEIVSSDSSIKSGLTCNPEVKKEISSNVEEKSSEVNQKEADAKEQSADVDNKPFDLPGKSNEVKVGLTCVKFVNTELLIWREVNFQRTIVYIQFKPIIYSIFIIFVENKSWWINRSWRDDNVFI